MSVKLLTEQCLELLSLQGGCPGLSEATLVKMPHCWKSRVTAQMSVSMAAAGMIIQTPTFFIFDPLIKENVLFKHFEMILDVLKYI